MTDPNPIAQSDFGQEMHVLEKRVERNDPVAIYEALLLWNDHSKRAHPWLTEALLRSVADLHLRRKPKWKERGAKPISVIRKRIEEEVRYRAVEGVMAWRENQEMYQEMPTKCIEAWFKQNKRHQDITTNMQVYEFVQLGLKKQKVSQEHQPLKCSVSTLKRVHRSGSISNKTLVIGRVAKVFGLRSVDSFFGTDRERTRGLL